MCLVGKDKALRLYFFFYSSLNKQKIIIFLYDKYLTRASMIFKPVNCFF